ncbi:MAG: SAF domain-containing protein [Microbacteriaceae bacterium]
MTSTLQPTGTNGKVRSARAAAAAPPRPPGGSVRRRWGRIGAGAAAAIIGAWVFAALYLSAGDRQEVVALSRDVGRLEVIDRSDLRVVRISSDTDVSTVDASRMNDIVGRVANMDLVAGSLLVADQLVPEGRQLLAPNEAVVGVLLGPGDSPTRSLRRGTPVLVVIRPASGTQGSTEEIEGWVFDASGEALNTRERPIELAVPRSKAGPISAAAADRRVTIVALAE